MNNDHESAPLTSGTHREKVMAKRIEIGFSGGNKGRPREKIKTRIVEHLRISRRFRKDYRSIHHRRRFDSRRTRGAACGPLSDPVIQHYALEGGLADRFDWLIEVGFRPGRHGQCGKTAAEAIALLTGKKDPGLHLAPVRHQPQRLRAPEPHGGGADRLGIARQRTHPAL